MLDQTYIANKLLKSCLPSGGSAKMRVLSEAGKPGA